MRTTKLAVLITILALLAFGLAACTPADGLIPVREEKGGEVEEPKYDQEFVQNVTPKLQEMVDAKDMTQESMNLIIEKIKSGEYDRPAVQAILAGTNPPPEPEPNNDKD